MRMEQGAPWLRRGLVAAGAFLAIGVAVIAALPHLAPASLSGARYPLIEMLDWDEFAPRDRRPGAAKQPKTFIAATRWLDAGKIDFALHGAMPVLCLSDDPRGFGADPRSRRFYWLGRPDRRAEHDSLAEARRRYGGNFDFIEPLAPVDILAGGKPAVTLQMFRAQNFHDPAPEYSLRRRERG